VSAIAHAQTVLRGKVLDAVTKEPVHGATVRCSCRAHSDITNADGSFKMPLHKEADTLFVSFIGYHTINKVAAKNGEPVIELVPSQSIMQEVVVSASREGVRRSQAPIAISSISARTLQDAKPSSFDQVLNKVSGVYMVNLGNEQHQMSIRQPITTKSLFLYLEDGIPVRTTGLFNHNALLEMNMAAVKNIEVIKGPSSSLYGSEAIGGVVNFITAAPTVQPVAKVSVQGNTIGYRRADLQSSFMKGKWGFVFNGYYAKKKNGFIEYSDFSKKTLSARVDYRFSEKTHLTNSVTWVDYYSDMPGGIDSAMFAGRAFTNPQTFTYRKVNAWRYRSTLSHEWNDRSKTTATIIYRSNSIGQNPAYSIKDDYRKVAGRWTGDKTVAHGEINESRFNSKAALLQHRQQLGWLNATLVGGVSFDYSPSAYHAAYIRVQKDTLRKKYVGYEAKDSTLTAYQTGISNYASFFNFEFSPTQKLRVVVSLRYDLFEYNYNNHLAASAYSGAPDSTNHFSAISPKVGFTYNFSARTGFYANYSQGFVPPQVTEMYRGVKVPELKPSVFYNYELGGWMEIVKNKLTADFSIYHLKGKNEVVSVRLDDGTQQNQNAGETSHKGIEFGLNSTLGQQWSFRISGAYSRHQFVQFIEKGTSYSGNQMNGAPQWMHNAELWYRPAFAKGLRVGAEWQRIGSYYMDPQNTVKYNGFHVLHLRAGYQYRGAEFWMNLMNATDNYYATNAAKSAYGYNYTLAEPAHVVIGFSYNIGELLKKK
ncbi:MAG: TonB-dependent receptor, partial [Chitinophagaceae bacterium]